MYKKNTTIWINIGLIFLFLQGCGTAPVASEKKITSRDFYVVPSEFGKQSLTSTNQGVVVPTPKPIVTNIASVPQATPISTNTPVLRLQHPLDSSSFAKNSGSVVSMGVFNSEVLVYASPVTGAFLSKNGVDGLESVQPWQVFLRKYQIPFRTINSVEHLERSVPGVLLLPSSVALSEREKQAIITFRAKGGNVLASWLTGVRDENGSVVGYDFMEKALDVKVKGNTEQDEKDNFLLPSGDNPVTHALPAGQRIWLERLKGWYPLRLEGRHSAAHIMDWSRTPVFGKVTSTIVYDEKIQASGKSSRSVVLGYPEQLWISADPRLLEAIAHNAVMWLLRQPAAYLAAWPHPYQSAFVMVVDVVGALTDEDLLNAKRFEEAGGRSTYYILAENAVKSVKNLVKLKSSGHEMAYLGDIYTDFKGHTETVQGERLDAMVKSVKGAGLDVSQDAGFRAPMDSYDQTTQKLLAKGGFGHLLATLDASEARLPYFANDKAVLHLPGTHKPLIVLPRTQREPEDAVDNCTPDIGIKPFLNELEMAEKMAGLSVVSIPTKSELTEEQSNEIFQHLRSRRNRIWLSTSGQVADWWRERARVSVRLDASVGVPRLELSISPGAVLRWSPTVLVNLPELGSTVRLVPRGHAGKAPQVSFVNSWQTSVAMDGLLPGLYQWDVYFDRPAAVATQ